MMTSLSLLDAAVAAVPVVIILLAVAIGSKQAREFHDFTGDESLLAHVAALSTFREGAGAPADAPSPRGSARASRRERRAIQHAKVA
jgi:hypothetical protein